METIIAKLTELGHKRLKSATDFSALEDFVEGLNVTDLKSVVLERMQHSDGPQILNYILFGLSQKGSSQKIRLKLSECIVKEIQSHEIPSRNVMAITSRLTLAMDKFSTPHLVRLCGLCVDAIRNTNSPTQTCWKELLPKIIGVLVTKKDIDHNGTVLNGEEFKQQMIQAICNSPWHPTIVASIASMFVDIPLSVDQQQPVVGKLCENLDDLPPSEIPPLVHQLLILCHDYHAATLFLSLRKYFGKHVYKLDEPTPLANSSAIQVNSEEDVFGCLEERGMSECESMVLYHIEECAKMGSGCVSQLLRLVKVSEKAHEFMLDPFLVAVLLSFSSISIYEAQVMGFLKNGIVLNILEDERKLESAWLRHMVTAKCDVPKVLTKLIKSKACERDKVLKGIVNLGLALLSTTHKRDSVAERAWSYGRCILSALVKMRRQVTKTVLTQLTDSIITGLVVTQYTDCLAQLCNASTLVMLENHATVIRLLEFLSELPAPVSERIVTAVLPLVRVSNRIRDTLILVLRKALFSSEVCTRKMAVSGFLLLLRDLKVKALATLSQSSSQGTFSGPSVFTQMNMEVHKQGGSGGANTTSNEAICLEVIGVLRRCFMQQASVKLCLYEGLQSALARNPDLCSSVLGVLLDHINVFYEIDQDTLPPLQIAKAITIQGTDAVLQEPLGALVFVTQQVVVKARQTQGDEEPIRSLVKLSEIMDSLVTRFSKCDLNHFQLDEFSNLLDIVPESLQRQEELRQALGIYEALMAYILASWCPASSIEHAQKLAALFKGHALLLDFAKNCKPCKDGEGSAKRGRKKDPDAVKVPAARKMQPYQCPETILDFPSIYRLLSLLFKESLDWASEESCRDLKLRRPLYRYATQVAIEVVTRAKASLALNKKPGLLQYATQLARLLYRNCLMRLNELIQFDATSAVQSVECFTLILGLVTTYFKNKIPQFLAETVGVAEDSGIGAQLGKVTVLCQGLLTEAVADDETEDPSLKRLVPTLINALALLAVHIPPNSQHAAKALEWTLDFARLKTLPSVPTTKSLISLLLSLQQRINMDVSLFDNIALQLGQLFGAINDSEIEPSPHSLAILTEPCKVAILPLLCATMASLLGSVEWVIHRSRADLALLPHPAATTDSPATRRQACKRREKEMVSMIGYCVNIAQSISSIAVPAGPCTETTVKLLTHTYCVLTLLTKYFSARSTQQLPVYQEARFSKVVKLAATHLSRNVAELLLYVEDHDNKVEKKDSKLMSQARKQAVYIPRLVAELENFTKSVVVLSNKCKDPTLSSNVKLTTTRDFRLNTKKLQQVIRANNQSGSEEEEERAGSPVEDVGNNENDARSTTNMNDSNRLSASGNIRENDEEQPPQKKPRTKTKK